jgi:hypothetical protein
MIAGMHHFVIPASGAVMRTIFTLDDDAAALARTCAKARSLRLGEAVSELIRRASAAPVALKKKGQVWVIAAPPGAPKPTSRQVKDMLDDPP